MSFNISIEQTLHAFRMKVFQECPSHYLVSARGLSIQALNNRKKMCESGSSEIIASFDYQRI